MRYLLLTGAGFSRNWGGWLANEALEYLLGSHHTDNQLRERLWIAKREQRGFEDVLADLQTQYEREWTAQVEQDLRNLTSALNAMFGEMAIGYERINFEPQNDTELMVKTFLQRFDVIYTLNQDTLIEQKYAGRQLFGGRYSACTCPGIKAFGSTLDIGNKRFQLYTPDPTSLRLYPN